MADKVTDLEEFSLRHIWRPYQTMMGYEDRLEKSPVSLEATARLLTEDSEWSRCVLDRIGRIGFSVPAYISHPLASIIREACLSARATNG